MRSILIAIAALTLSSAYGSEKLQYDNLDYSSFGNWAAIPGAGFNYKKKEFTGYNCLAGSESPPTGKPEANLDFSMSLDSESIKKELGISADAKTMMGTGEISGAAKFLKATAESSTSITMNYVGTIHFANRNFEQTGLNPYGKSLAKMPSYLENACGQGFVKQIVRGAKLFFSIRFDFGSRDDKDAFALELHYKSPMTSINAEVHNNSETISKHARVTVSAYQLGGQVEKLAYIFKNAPIQQSTDKAGGAKAHYAAIECAMGSGLDDCKQALSDALAYATDEVNPDSFPRQIDSSKDPKDGSLNNLLANLSYLIVPYQYPEMAKIPGLDAAVEEQKQNLYELLSENIDALEQIDNLRHGIIAYTDAQMQTFATGEGILRKRQKLMIDTAVYCYQQDEIGCGAKVGALASQLDGASLHFDKKILDPDPVTFAQFCASTHSLKPKYVDLTERDSVLAIEEIVSRTDGPMYQALQAKNYFAQDADAIQRCTILQNILLAQSQLDLSFKKESHKIQSLEVIGNLSQLQKLTLRNQSVQFVDPLQGFHDLEYLDAEGNRIQDATPLAKNLSLQTVRLAGNLLRTVDALKTLPNLSVLDVRKNLPTVQCFSTPLLQQCMIARSKWLVQFTNTTNSLDLGLLMGQVTEFAGGYAITGARQGHRSNYVAVLDKQAQTGGGFTLRTGTLQVGHMWSGDTKIDDSHLLITGGWPSSSLNVVEVYDMNGGFRSAAGTMIDARAGHTATLLDSGLVLVAGGYSSTFSLATDNAQSTAELIDPHAAGGPKVTLRIEMNAPRAWHTATKLADGRVVLVGGFAGSRGIRAMEVFDPKTNKFTSLGNLRQGRGGHSISPLPDGTFLIAGGFIDNATAADSAEILDPRTLTTRLTKGKLNQGRGMHLAQVLPNGEVLLAGGMTQPAKVGATPQEDDDGLNLIEMLGSAFDFKKFADRDKDGKPSGTEHFGVCQICLDSTEVYLPAEESFVTNPESLNLRRAGSALVPVNTGSGPFSFRVWGGIDSATSTTVESGTVTEDQLN